MNYKRIAVLFCTYNYNTLTSCCESMYTGCVDGKGEKTSRRIEDWGRRQGGTEGGRKGEGATNTGREGGGKGRGFQLRQAQFISRFCQAFLTRQLIYGTWEEGRERAKEERTEKRKAFHLQTC